MTNKSQTTNKTALATIKLDWKTARLVAAACVVVAELEDTDGNDAAALHLAWHEIQKAIDDAR